MSCLSHFLGVCVVSASSGGGADFFGFAEFIGAFALLAIVFTIADIQYRFRVSVAPLALPVTTFWVIVLAGFGTLLTDIWVSQGWPVIYVSYMTYGVIQGLFAAAFLGTTLLWLYFAFLKPPLFSKWNSKRYAQTLFSYLLRGSDAELPTIAVELGRSAESLLDIFKEHAPVLRQQKAQQEKGEDVRLNPGNDAVNVLSMIGNRKFCRHVIASSPSTAIRFFQVAAEKEIFDAPFSQFSKNVSSEALENPDSNLFHEDSWFSSGLLGDLKPFTQSIYGSYRLVEGLGHNHGSPLDVDYFVARNWNGNQLEAYCRAVLTTFEDRLEHGYWYQHSFSLQRALGHIENASYDVYQLDGLEDGDSDISERLRVSVRFIRDLIELLEKYEDRIEVSSLKPERSHRFGDIYDPIAKVMSEIIYHASAVTKPVWQCWHIQHNTVWGEFFGRLGKSTKTRKRIEFKLRRLIYDEIVDFDKYEDLKSFKAARYLGISLNCMGIVLRDKEHRDSSTAPLHKLVLTWVKEHYADLSVNHPSVAEACLMGGMSYDKETKRLVRTCAARADKEPNRDYLQL